MRPLSPYSTTPRPPCHVRRPHAGDLAKTGTRSRKGKPVRKCVAGWLLVGACGLALGPGLACGQDAALWQRAIEDAKHFVLILSRLALTSDWIKREWSHARMVGKRVSPVLADPTPDGTETFTVTEPDAWPVAFVLVEPVPVPVPVPVPLPPVDDPP